ncbi:AAA family ATPase [Agromyces silvae]|uniref:AAA family ATPase n=1 Tax=Agromyces silvae TaxID=3388266 RepID=UPI00280BCD6E|nr:AAA family ATPase [Agromyces protaetiae]
MLGAGLRGEPSPILGRPTWTRENARRLSALVGGENADLGDRSFFEKLSDQIGSESDDLLVFVAELLFVHVLPLSDFKPTTKIERVDRVLSWAPSRPATPDWMRRAVELPGVFRGGVGFKVQVWAQLLWMCRFVETWFDATDDQRRAALGNPWAFGALVATTPKDSPAIRASICYLTWPGSYEAVVRAADRKLIRDAFAHEIGGASGNDEEAINRDLEAIRTKVDDAAGSRVHWYREPYRSQWEVKTSAGRRAWLVRAKQGGAALVQSWLDDGFVSLPATNLELDVATAAQPTIRAAVESGYAHLTYAQRLTLVREYSDFILKMSADDVIVGILDDALVVGSVLGDAELVEGGSSRLRRPAAWSASAPGLKDLPEPLPSLLDGQGAVVDVTSALGVLDQYLAPERRIDDDDLSGDEPPLPPPVATVPELPAGTDELAASLHMPRPSLQEIIELLQDRQQLVFYGPPGTGKTYVAQAIARHVVGSDRSRVRLVQFHPSYAYEDFFEGLRPSTESGTVTFELKPGPLRQIADEARLAENADAPYVLIIDEMNRGNLAKVFGELYYLLEYRNEAVRLQYSGDIEEFRLPKNLFIIGTMNTVDRSISLVDAAIRRRFPFVELHPAVEPTKSVLESYLRANHVDTLRAQLLAELNSRIDERDLQIGPSFLMRTSASTKAGLERIWKYDILPLLEDHYYGQRSPEVIREQFGLDALLRAVDSRRLGPVDLAVDTGTAEYEGRAVQSVGPTGPSETGIDSE